MSIFKNDMETKRVIFNVSADLADRLEAAKQLSRRLGKRLDVDTPVNKSIEKFLKKAEKKLAEILHEAGDVAPEADASPADAVDVAGEGSPRHASPEDQGI